MREALTKRMRAMLLRIYSKRWTGVVVARPASHHVALNSWGLTVWGHPVFGVSHVTLTPAGRKIAKDIVKRGGAV